MSSLPATLNTDVVGWDQETHLFGPGNVQPPVVCGAFCRTRALSRTIVLDRDAAFEATRDLLRDERITGARTAYDLGSAMVTWPELTPLIFAALHERRVHDVQIREGLISLATTGDVSPDGSLPSLSDLEFRYLALDRSDQKVGSLIWRKLYHELDGVSAAHYPDDARLYVQQDAWGAREVHLQQEDPQPEWLHVAASFCYTLMTARGIVVDRKLKRKLQRQVEAELSPDKLKLIYKAGLVTAAKPPVPHAKGHRHHVLGCSRKGCDCPPKLTAPVPEKVAKNAALVPLIMRICAENNLEIPMTEPTAKFEHGQVKTDEETIAALSGYDPALAQFHTRMEKVKLLTSYFPAMEWPFHSGRTAFKVYPGYETLKKTGRGSSRGTTKKRHASCSCYEGTPCENATYPSLNVQQADPRVRACYLPHPGHVFVVADFSAIDLVCMAQTLYRLFGKSELRDQINAGLNPHTVLAADFAIQQTPWFAKLVRGKSEEEAYAAFKALEKDHRHACVHHEDGWDCAEDCKAKFYKDTRDLAKKIGLGLGGGMGLARLCALVAKELHRTITMEQAKFLKRVWLRRYPTAKEYLEWVMDQKDGQAGEWLCYTSPLGMRRARTSYPETANGNALQSPAAEGMKIAQFLITRACYDPTLEDVLYGCKPLINMHDELVGEVPITTEEIMDAQARRWSDLMVRGQRVICPDVDVKAEPLLTTRWVKEAKQKKNAAGLIVPWLWGEDK